MPKAPELPLARPIASTGATVRSGSDYARCMRCAPETVAVLVCLLFCGFPFCENRELSFLQSVHAMVNDMRALTLFAVVTFGTIGWAFGQDSPVVTACDPTLFRTAVTANSHVRTDYRLAHYISDDDFKDLTKNASASVVIYGVPVTGGYGEYQKNTQSKIDSTNSSLHIDDARAVAVTGLNKAGAEAYTQCLENEVMKVNGGQGLHIFIRSATEKDIALYVHWYVPGLPTNATVTWDPQTIGKKKLPTKVSSGVLPIVIPRPREEQTLAISYKGYGSSVTLPPYVPPPLPSTGSNYIRRSYYFCAASNLDGCPDNTGVLCIHPDRKEDSFDPTSAAVSSDPGGNAKAELREHDDKKVCIYAEAGLTKQGGNSRVNALLTVYEVVPPGIAMPDRIIRGSKPELPIRGLVPDK